MVKAVEQPPARFGGRESGHGSVLADAADGGDAAEVSLAGDGGRAAAEALAEVGGVGDGLQQLEYAAVDRIGGVGALVLGDVEASRERCRLTPS